MTDAMGEDQLLPVCIVDRFLADVDEIEDPIIQSETLIDVEIFSTAFRPGAETSSQLETDAAQMVKLDAERNRASQTAALLRPLKAERLP
jgi:hypothetical protein